MFVAGNYKIVFKRIWHTDDEGESLMNGRYDTKCEIWLNDEESQIPRFTGIAKLHPNDRPDKIIGKKIALQNAIGHYHEKTDCIVYSCADFYKKETRTSIWKTFWLWVADWPRNISVNLLKTNGETEKQIKKVIKND